MNERNCAVFNISKRSNDGCKENFKNRPKKPLFTFEKIVACINCIAWGNQGYYERYSSLSVCRKRVDGKLCGGKLSNPVYIGGLDRAVQYTCESCGGLTEII
jgi:hypothetical protein